MSKNQALNKCPYCFSVGEMKYDAASDTYTCLACDQQFAKSMIEEKVSSGMSAVVSQAIRDIDSPDSALVYLESFFETYDWEKYDLGEEVFIDDLRIMVEKNKIKNAINPKTWQVEFKSVADAICHKVGALKKLQAEILDKYDGDIASVSDEYMSYITASSAICDARDMIKKILEADIKNMKKFGADATAVAEAESTLAKLARDLDEVSVETEVESLPEVKKFMAEKERKQIEEFSKRGIDAEQRYNNGIHAYEVKKFGDALSNFDMIRGFRDVNRYINRINSVFFFGDLVVACGRTFKAETHKAIPLDMSQAKKGCKKSNAAPAAAAAEEEEDLSGSLDLHEVVDGEVEKKASVSGFTGIICAYGDYLYYLKKNSEIWCYDVASKVEKQIDKSEFGYHMDDANEFGYSFDKKKVYIRKALTIDAFKAKGCFKAFTAKKQEAEYLKSVQNNYSMLVLDLSRGEIEEKIPKMIGCIGVHDYIFFTVSECEVEDHKHGSTYVNKAKMYNLKSDTTEELFKENCEILGVSGNKVAYSIWTPNSLNRELHVIDYITKEDKLIEANIFKFLDIKKGKIFYKVGNKNVSPLFSVNLDGTERTEVYPNYSQDDIDLVNGWIYIRKGGILLKVSVDGKDRFILAYDIGTIIKYAGNYIYYIDNSADKSFRVVKLDGTSNIKIADGIAAADISVGIKYVYYMRREWVGSKYSRSVYRMDLDGHNAKKIVFDVLAMKDKNSFDESAEIYLKKTEQKNYEFKFKNSKDDFTQSYPITTYYTLKKQSGELTPVLVLGVPTPENFQRQGGCAFSKKLVSPEIKELPRVIDYGQITEEPGEALTLNTLAAAISSVGKSDSKGGGKDNKPKGLIATIITIPITLIRGVFKLIGTILTLPLRLLKKK